ncbi:MAG TPA: GtrA family protein [Candidatus Paceibacterota bacterium]|nr:GtrA family protein [Candidatus Paceibacterota bacterium]
MPKKDFQLIAAIGAAVGLLAQPIIGNLVAAPSLALRLGAFVGFLVLAPFALWIAKLLSRFWAGLYQFAQFAAVGTLNSFIDLGILNLETSLYGTSAISNSLFAVFKAISFVCATTNSFIWNKEWTFGAAKEKTGTGKVTAFYLIAGVGWALNVGAATFVKSIGPSSSETIMKVWVNIVAPVAGIVASFAWDFLGYKYFVFKHRPEAAAKL